MRDRVFDRYGPETIKEIQRDPEREYSNYNYDTIRMKIKEIDLIALGFRMHGIWVGGDLDFFELCQLDRLPDDDEKKGKSEYYGTWEKHTFFLKHRSAKKDMSKSILNADTLLDDFAALSIGV